MVPAAFAAQLQHLLKWLADPITPVATASAVLQGALTSLERLAASCSTTRQILAAVGGPGEWAPVAAALHRRLPRRMKARYLPDIDRVSAVVYGSSSSKGRGGHTVPGCP